MADAGVRRSGRARKPVKTLADEQAERNEAAVPAAPASRKRKDSTAGNAVKDEGTAMHPPESKKAKTTKKIVAVKSEDISEFESPPTRSLPATTASGTKSKKVKREHTDTDSEDSYLSDASSSAPAPTSSPEPEIEPIILAGVKVLRHPTTGKPRKIPHGNLYLRNGDVVSGLLDYDTENAKRPVLHPYTGKPRKTPNGAIYEVPAQQKKPSQWQREFKEKSRMGMEEEMGGGGWNQEELTPPPTAEEQKEEIHEPADATRMRMDPDNAAVAVRPVVSIFGGSV